MTINVEKFIEWLATVPMVFETKQGFMWMLTEYAKQNGSKESDSEWDRWLDKEFKYSKDNLEQGLPASIFNAIARSGNYDYDLKEWNRPYKTNRNLYEATDTELEEIRLMSRNKVEIVRKYLELNRKRIKGEQ